LALLTPRHIHARHTSADPLGIGTFDRAIRSRSLIPMLACGEWLSRQQSIGP
jgi:hypothetical protein